MDGVDAVTAFDPDDRKIATGRRSLLRDRHRKLLQDGLR
jgi:hypothetical protein